MCFSSIALFFLNVYLVSKALLNKFLVHSNEFNLAYV